MKKASNIRDLVIENVDKYPNSITRFIAEKLGVSRQIINYHINHMIDEGLLIAEGKTKNRRYYLKKISDAFLDIEITSELAEDKIWTEHFDNYFKQFRSNIYDICYYGFTEMLNNAIDHSEASVGLVGYRHYPNRVEIHVSDKGIGIFNKISRELGLTDQREAILELSKGKFTTDPDKHTGEGIFYTSRMFDEYRILSGNLFFRHQESQRDWLIEITDKDLGGTLVTMIISPKSERTTREIFDKFSGEEYDYAFKRTHVPLQLAKFGEEKLVSRSQAKRVLSRFDRFDEVLLDFAGIEFVGRAFADEIFRVYSSKHPDTEILWVNANDRIERMIWNIVESAE